MKIFLVTLVLLIIADNCFAQSAGIFGTIKNSRTNKALANVVVKIIMDSYYKILVGKGLTDDSGMFHIKPLNPGKYTLQVFYKNRVVVISGIVASGKESVGGFTVVDDFSERCNVLFPVTYKRKGRLAIIDTVYQQCVPQVLRERK